MPVRHRDLSEVINPQPDAIHVIRKLLNWIEAVDLASQRGGSRPAFKTAQGEPIFPGEDVLWWLTDVQRKTSVDAMPPGDQRDAIAAMLSASASVAINCSTTAIVKRIQAEEATD